MWRSTPLASMQSKRATNESHGPNANDWNGPSAKKRPSEPNWSIDQIAASESNAPNDKIDSRAPRDPIGPNV